MRKIDRLKKEAKEAAEWRGHKLTKWIHFGIGRTISASSSCKNCTGLVSVDAWPPPNGIEIAGKLVALNCPVEKEN